MDEVPYNTADVTRIVQSDREIILVGTAHISRESVELVREVIEAEEPDLVAVELDEQRYEALRSDDRWKDLDLLEVIKQGKLTFLLARLALMGFQKSMGARTGVAPGAEMAEAADVAEQMGVEVFLCDRNVQTTLLRAWRRTPWLRRAEVALLLFASLFQGGEDVTEEDLADMRRSENMMEILNELRDAVPELAEVVIDERDIYMAHQLQSTDADKVVAVVGAAHKPGIRRWLEQPIPQETIDEITHIPPKSTFSKIWPWLFPVAVISLFIYGFFQSDWTTVKTAAYAWVLANGVLSSVGAIAALAHPVTVIAAFLAAPFTSLNPTVGAGMATALVQTLVDPPTVADLENIGDDLSEWTGWWKNRLGRVALVFLFSSVGSSVGTLLAFGWLKNLL